MDPFEQKPPLQIEMLVYGYMRSIACDSNVQISDLIIRICACIYYFSAVVWDETVCHKEISLNEDKSIVSSRFKQRHAFKNAYITGVYNHKTQKIFKFKVKNSYGSFYFGLMDVSQDLILRRIDTYSVSCRQISNDCIRLHLMNGQVSWGFRSSSFDSVDKIPEGINFRIGVSLPYGESSVEILQD